MIRLLARIMRQKPVSAPLAAVPASPDPWHLGVTFKPAGTILRLTRSGHDLAWSPAEPNRFTPNG